MTQIIPKIGREEIRDSPPFEGELALERDILGESDILDPTTYRQLPEDNYVEMRGQRDDDEDRAARVAMAIAPGVLGQIRTDLIAPFLVMNLEESRGSAQQQGAVLQAIGDRTRQLSESQVLHRGYFSLPATVSRAVIEYMFDRPGDIPGLFSSFDGKRPLSVDEETATAISQQIAGAATIEEVVNRIVIAQAAHMVGDAGGTLEDACSSTDARTFRYSARTGQVVDPSYYESDMYGLTAFPFEDPQDVYNNIRHMVVGFPGPTGNDHMYLYANSPDKPNALASAKGDYSLCRSGNYVFHDLATIAARAENSVKAGDTWIAQAPFEVVLDYAAFSYLGGMMVDTERLHETSHVGVTDGILFSMDDVSFRFPLKKVDRIIPARVLRKGSEEPRLYGTEDYLAELVDIAMEVDKIHEISGRSKYLSQGMIDRLYAHAQVLRPEAEPILRRIVQKAQVGNIKPLHISYALF
ncbi:MAG TPA: hypothetical protein VLG92_02795 [Candidatus Saccharimonadia bacterium]|nr:hypothetical protein [Candidatus Saccharimonadia bacterium]